MLASPFEKACLPVGRGDRGDFMVILLISSAFEIHFSKG